MKHLPMLCLIFVAATAFCEKPATPTPQSLVELTFDFGEDVEFESYSVNLTLQHSIESGSHLLVSPIADLVINGTPLTAGLATDAGGYHFKHQRDRENDVGKAVGLWMPGTNEIALAQPKENQLFDRGTEADPFIGVLGPVDWQKGQYTLFVRKQSQRTLKGKDYTWIEASVYSHVSGRETYSGSIRFEGTDFMMDGTVAARIQVGEGKTVPKAKLKMSGWKINGEDALPLSASVRFPEGVPQLATCKMVAKDVVVVLGLEAQHKKNRDLTKTADGYEQTLYKLKTSPVE